jgi:hypothetical protein
VDKLINDKTTILKKAQDLQGRYQNSEMDDLRFASIVVAFIMAIIILCCVGRFIYIIPGVILVTILVDYTFVWIERLDIKNQLKIDSLNDEISNLEMSISSEKEIAKQQEQMALDANIKIEELQTGGTDNG